MITQTTLRPGQKGTKALARKYGDRLVCVRHKYDKGSGRRYITVELIEQETEIPTDPERAQAQCSQRRPQRLGIRVEYWESDVRKKVKEAGGIWRPRYRLWEMGYEEVVALGLESRIVGTNMHES